MFREKINDLQKWKDKPNRKPLIVNGARQVGKSWLIKHFGETYFQGKVIVVNLEKSKNLHTIFKPDLDAKRILFELGLALNTTIEKGEDLLFIDEIQACPEALGSLRYFYEEIPELHVIAAGSLLDFEFRNQPFPVGRVETLNMYPMTFYEFLKARGKEQLCQLLKTPLVDIPEGTERYFDEDFNLYLVVGGMPECVRYFVETNDLQGIRSIQEDLLYTYEQDFKKYTPTVNPDCLTDILENATKLMGHQVIYTKLSERFSSPTIKKGVEVLRTARLLHSVQNVSVNALPLTAAGKQFKLFFLDVGLLLRKSNLDYQSFYIKRELSSAFQGMLAEQFVAQQFIAYTDQKTFYWARTEAGASSEVDFVMVKDGKILPIEVKSGKSGSLKSLHYLLEHHPTIGKAIVFSHARQGTLDKIQFVPLVFAGNLGNE
ncbi:AAA family ATPase [Runella sp. MFBS21]|uniref:ATP-binding protein n=1 Tax=Runella sp. MFBS21 TaxID=3034018 RepID=UPI0023FA0D53|nr:AAA family ATPase [Runella sp. MFBS21]MDF7818434.1 AAA family ATPase [Runella sp. MFBS21]